MIEFLIIWFLGNDIIDSGLRYTTAEEGGFGRQKGYGMLLAGI